MVAPKHPSPELAAKYADWIETFRDHLAERDVASWAMADLVASARREGFGSTVTEMAEALNINRLKFSNIGRVATAFPPDKRDYRVPFDVHIRDVPKVEQFPKARLALGWTGFAPMFEGKYVNRVAERFAALGIKSDHPDQGEILAALPGVLQDMHAENIAWLAGDVLLDDRAALTLVVACYRESDASPVLLVGLTGGGPVAPYELFRVRQLVGTDGPDADAFLRQAFGGMPDMSDPQQFDARRDGLALLELQRRIPPAPWHFGYYGVGGKAMLTTISPTGVRSQILKRWPDKIGKPIRPR